MTQSLLKSVINVQGGHLDVVCLLCTLSDMLHGSVTIFK
jgi:hypothetical protein